MRMTTIKAKVKHGEKEIETEFLIDSGATYTALSEKVWKKLGLRPKKEIGLILADGRKIKRNISECRIEISPYGEFATPVILGERGDVNLLGIITLEIFGLILDPLKRKLLPIKAYMV